ncbi:SLAP domain-containing protein [Lactobacillus crispatus]|uniref:S-layer protein n=1 Tax=Lactobacillus crispatus (strain ST1) TaxID=748671 RepID=D5H0T9_LACCS|nr:SLAP domain-containing protein [Lactobacillus crispatus]CBL49624.1 S-layer protein [Lactobacillus crispatus ST1]
MKKNLRIVSAAAAALLAVAPVAASAVSVNAADNTTVNATNSSSDYSHINLGGSDVTKYIANVNPSFTLNGALRKNNDNTNANAQAVAAGSLTGSITANVGGVTATANLIHGNHGAANIKVVSATNASTVIYDGTGDHESNPVKNFNAVVSGQKYVITVNSVGFNFGANNAGKKVTLALPKTADIKFTVAPNGWSIGNDGKTLTGSLDNNGTVNGIQLTETLTAFDAANTNNVVFYNIATGQQVNSGNTMVLADYNGQLNVNSLKSTIESNFKAFQRLTTASNSDQNGQENTNTFDNPPVVTTVDEIKDQLEKAGIKVNAADNFTAPHSFTVTVTAKSNVNGKTAQLPVTFTVANVAEPTVASQSKTIMHNAYFYKEDGTTRANNDKAKRYESVTVAMSTKKIGNKDFYEVIKDGKATGMYINADNIDGTKRTLKHNAYVYKTSKKRANKVVLKKGDTVVTYGGTYTFKNGKQYYKINNNTEKTYVKASNF